MRQRCAATTSAGMAPRSSPTLHAAACSLTLTIAPTPLHLFICIGPVPRLSLAHPICAVPAGASILQANVAAPRKRRHRETESMSATGPSTTPDHIRQAWNEAHVSPLWEALEAHSTEVKRDRAYIWKWATMKPLVENALALQDMAAIQRRVLTFNNPNLRTPNAMGATPTLTAAL